MGVLPGTPKRRLKIARISLGSAQTSLETRLVDLYQNGSPISQRSFSARPAWMRSWTGLKTANRVSDQDTQILNEVRRFRDEIKQREAELEQARSRQEQVVAERAARREQIEGALAERQQLLASIKDQIVQLKAEERERQRRLEAQARARVAAQAAEPAPPRPSRRPARRPRSTVA